MYSKIIVGYDGSDGAKDALAFGGDLSRTTGAELCVGGVLLLQPVLYGGIDPAHREAEAEFAARLERAADSVDAAAQPVHSSSPARGLHELAEDVGADLIVVGSSRHGRVGQTLLGNVGVALMHGSPCAIAIAPTGYRDQADRDLGTIVVGFDGSAEAGLALMAASRLAREIGARMKLVSVAEHALDEAIEKELRDTLTQGCSAVPEGIEAEPILASGEPAAALVEAAKEPGTVLMLGSRAYGPLRSVLLGSVSRALVRSAPSPVIVHPRGTHEPARQASRAQAEVTS